VFELPDGIDINGLAEIVSKMKPHELAQVGKILSETTPVWVPLPGPQTEAMKSQADVLFFGGSAGGGKTALLVGLALTQHHRSIIFRREATQLQGVIDYMAQILKTRDGFNGQEKIWRLPQYDKQIELGSCPNIGDEVRFQGRPHDLIGLDEICHFHESQFRFLCGWLRTTKPGQRCRIVCTGNPPTDSDGEWVIRYFAPWLNPDHPNPAKSGELRYFAMVDGKEVERPDGEPFVVGGETITPQSRTFIRSNVKDNPFLLATGYEQTLQALPEPLRSQMLHGNFLAGGEDHPFQVIPTQWVKLAQERWMEDGDHRMKMDTVGVDVARGGKDETVIQRRYGLWFAPPLVYPGHATPDGPAVASLVLVAMRDGAVVEVDAIGVGASVYDHLASNNIQAVPVIGSEGALGRDRSGLLTFANLRAELWWKLREALDPQYGEKIMLPPGANIRADLCAPRWKLAARGIQIEGKDDIIKRIGRSPNIGDAIVYANKRTPKRKAAEAGGIPAHILEKLKEQNGRPGAMTA
jgi:hypothetical protein